MAVGISSGRDHACRALALHVLDDQPADVCGAGLAEVLGLRVEVLDQFELELQGDGGPSFLVRPAGHGLQGV